MYRRCSPWLGRKAICPTNLRAAADEQKIPAVDWIVQFDPPDDPRDYIHRVGRTARGSGGKGRSLMFLQPSEVGFLKHLKEARVPVVEFEFPTKKIANVQPGLEKLISQNYYLNKVSSLSTPSPCFFSSFLPCFPPSSMEFSHCHPPRIANPVRTTNPGKPTSLTPTLTVGQGRLPLVPTRVRVAQLALGLQRP